jgi:hypothetical protein
LWSTNIITQKYLFPGALHGPGKPQGSKVKLPIFGFEFPMGKHTPNQNRPWIWMKKQWFEPNYTMNHFTCIMIVAMVATGRKTSSPKKISLPWGPSWSW